MTTTGTLAKRGCRRRLAPSTWRHGYTLIELMVVISIIAFLAMAVVTSMYGAAESAKRMRTQQTITKIDSQLMPRWESYMTRRLPLNAPLTSVQTGSGIQVKKQFAMQKLWAMRELLRMDFPDRYRDLLFSPVFLTNPPNTSGNVTPYYSDLGRQYQRMITQWTGKTFTNAISSLQVTHESAECLYLTIMVSGQDTEMALSAFTPNEFGDTDGDYMPEFLDAWGNSIEFIRWAPGFISDMQPVYSISPSDPAASQYAKGLPQDPSTPGNFLSHFPVSYNPYTAINSGTSSSSASSTATATQYAIVNYHDAFDPLEIDPGAGVFPVPERGFNLIPLIVSAGPDGGTNQSNFASTTTMTDTLDSSFGLHWGTSTTTPATGSNQRNTDDDPYMQYASPDGTGQTQRGAPDTTGASADNIHNQLMRTRP